MSERSRGGDEGPARGRIARAGLGLARAALIALAPALAACPAGDDGDDGIPPDFPEDYAASYVEVRNCRGSGDHELHNIRILVDPSALEAYQARTVPFPAGAVVLKEEYDFGDIACSGDVVRWTVMRKLAAGSGTDTLGWAWQEVDAERRVVTEDEPSCIGCHQGCGVAPDGHDGTCAVP